MKRRGMFATVLGLLILGVVGLRLAQAPAPQTPTGSQGQVQTQDRAQAVEVAATDRVAGFTYRRPAPGDPDYDDYQAMLRDPYYARFVHEGSKPPFYDPEWRAPIDGRRQVPENKLSLEGGASDLEELGTFLLMALADNDGGAIDQLRVNRDEFELLCWPEFPQSRPYLRIPADEAWTLHFANLRKGARKALHQLGGKSYTLVTLKAAEVEEFTNFRLWTGLTFVVEDPDGQRIELNLLTTLIECRGRFKIFMFNEHFDYET